MVDATKSENQIGLRGNQLDTARAAIILESGEVDGNDFLRLTALELTWLRGETKDVDLTNDIFARTVEFDGDDQVIEKLKELLRVVDNIEYRSWSNLDALVILLPDWFLLACSKPFSNDEMVAWLDKWRALSGDAQKLLEEERGWSAIDWLHWLHPQQRGWFVVLSEFRIGGSNQLTLATCEWLIPLGSLTWALRCAGATRVDIQAF